MDLIKGQELYVNNQWFFDVLDKAENESILVKIKYKEAPNREYVLNKTVKLPINLLTIEEDCSTYLKCKIDLTKLKSLWGSLVDRIVKEKNPYALPVNEDGGAGGGAAAGGGVACATAGNTGGMGAVSNPGLSGVPGVPGTAGSGDIATGLFGKKKKGKAFGYSKIPASSSSNLKKALMNSLGMKKEELAVVDETSSDYKKKLYDFLDWPWKNDTEIETISEINTNRKEFETCTPAIIKTYLKDMWDMNKSLIKGKCTSQFVNQLMLCADASE